MSSGVPMRLNGDWAAALNLVHLGCVLEHAGDSGPGTTEFTVIPLGPSSFAKTSV
jgi:hypothetical protein